MAKNVVSQKSGPTFTADRVVDTADGFERLENAKAPGQLDGTRVVPKTNVDTIKGPVEDVKAPSKDVEAPTK